MIQKGPERGRDFRLFERLFGVQLRAWRDRRSGGHAVFAAVKSALLPLLRNNFWLY
jgi:hypothetical protein